jgi:hypothetical protein
MRCTTRTEQQGKPRRSGARGLPSDRLSHGRDQPTKVKGELEPTPQTRTDPDEAALRLRLLRAVQGAHPCRRSRRVVANRNTRWPHPASCLLRGLPSRQRPGRQGVAVTRQPGVSSVTDLADQIIAIVTGHPGITTIGICRAARVRKCDVLVELERLRREQVLRFQKGHRGSKCWFVVPGPSTCSRTCSRGTSASAPDVASGTQS